MANIMNMVKLRNKTSRNGFDLSRKNLFTAKVGEMLPVSCIECIPGDSFNIDMAWFTRTQPVNTAAYTRIREYYDWYFVPTNLLWNKFNTFVTQMTGNNMNADGVNSSATLTDSHPYFTTSQVKSYLNRVKSSSASTNFFGYDRASLMCKLLHYLDYGDFQAYLDGEVLDTNVKLNPFPLLAYQKIYQDYVRDSQWERAYAPAANINYLDGSSGSLVMPISEITASDEHMFDLRYYNWNKDYFTGLLPSAQYGDAASINMSGNVTVPSRAQSQRDVFVPANSVGVYVGTYSGGNELFANSQFSVLALRQAEAKQKWSEITQSQQQDYKSQIAAHFGVDVSNAYSERCQYIGGVGGNIDIEGVTNNNLTGDNDAKIAGRGQGGARGSVNFKADVHGYLMCIYHAVPLLDYAIDGVKRQNLKTTVTDYAIPEFDATGMVSVPIHELTSSIVLGTGGNGLLGYAPRYIDYKTGYDLVHGAFYNGGLDAWVAPMSREYFNEYISNVASSGSTNLINYNFFKVPPAVVNTIFGVAADSTNATDQLLVNAAFDIKAVRNLDRNGLPY